MSNKKDVQKATQPALNKGAVSGSFSGKQLMRVKIRRALDDKIEVFDLRDKDYEEKILSFCQGTDGYMAGYL